jgi:hypothetical protein
MNRVAKALAVTFGSAVLAMVVLAVFMPVVAYSGPGMGTGRVAQCAQQSFRRTGAWPETITLEDQCLRRRPRYERYDLSAVRLGAKPDSALYRIRLNGREEVWRVDGMSRPTKVHSEG